jgi:hypothetical protein
MTDNVMIAIASLWQQSGAKLRGYPIKKDYLVNQKRPEGYELHLQYGVPKLLYTPNAIYQINTQIEGDVFDFATRIGCVFEIGVIQPHDHEQCCEYRTIAATHYDLIISLKSDILHGLNLIQGEQCPT